MSAAQGSYELVLCGSPRKNGVSSRYAAQLTAELEAKGVVIEHWNVADHAVSGCIGCEGCRRARWRGGGSCGGTCVFLGANGAVQGRFGPTSAILGETAWAE